MTILSNVFQEKFKALSNLHVVVSVLFYQQLTIL